MRRRGTVGSLVGTLAIVLGTLLVLGAGSLATFGVSVVIDMWDSDAGGRAGSGRSFATGAAMAALVGLVLDLTTSRRTVSTR